MNLEKILLSENSYPTGSSSYYLHLALQQAIGGICTSSPNPSVGCVIVTADGQLIASGYHKAAGLPHAEIEALNQIDKLYQNAAGEWQLTDQHFSRLQNATLYVTLEPCAHRGRTPSCAVTLSKLPIKKVVSILKDPNPLVSGKGFEILKNNNIEIECLEDQYDKNHPLIRQAHIVHQSFLFWVQRRSPYYALKVAESIDGFIGLNNGESQWITSEETRFVAREMRAMFDCIMTGKGTVLLDNPYLDLRGTQYSNKPFPIYIWDTNLELLRSTQLNLLKNRTPGQITLLSQNHLENHAIRKNGKDYDFCQTHLENVNVVLLPKDNYNCFKALNELLLHDNIQSVWVEAGGRLSSYLIKYNMINRLYLFKGPKLIGGQSGISWTHNIEIPNLKNAYSLKYDLVRQIGSDLLISALFT
jgi:diaminohydroxyphosphoribosylaminopyrimidine deaminase/5-amino-6-(5-phosphoribosylamino)uracil reductase